MFSSAAAPPVDANNAKASSDPCDLTPLGRQEDHVFAYSTRNATDEDAAVPAPVGRGLKQLRVPTSVLHDLRPPTRPYQLIPVLSQRPTGSPAQYTPWTPTRALQRRKHITKRMGFLVQVLEREQIERVRAARPLPDFRAGDILEVRMMLPEAERKVTIYRGVCIARYHKGIRSTFKLYNVYPECGGVVQHIPLYMPDLLGIKVVGRIHSSQVRPAGDLSADVHQWMGPGRAGRPPSADACHADAGWEVVRACRRACGRQRMLAAGEGLRASLSV
jgi:large subunit ribosomal protein L19